MNLIEETLFKTTEILQEGQIYSNHWKYVKTYLPTILETISQIFPHYSLHNSTHSEAILNNIVKIVGEESIKKLSVVDLWLLLTSAYYHDCGMVVTGADKSDLFKDGSGFVKYVETIQNTTSSPLYQYAILYEVREQKIYYRNEQLTCDSYEGIRFLIADYIRKNHAERSSKKIEAEESFTFPGQPIPKRIINILQSICNCHTKDVSEVMKLQPIESSGCGTENCHPRFVAAMLRLGDLLDVDSNRVSEVLLSTLGSIPSDSKNYNLTNRSISHIRIDRSIIEITAECDNYQIADLINRWFQWLNDELVYYMKNWHWIIPFEDFGYLPTVGDLKVNLSEYDTFDGKTRPCFDIDTNKAIELLQGAGLYRESCECIRELLQNAVDATYLRIYKEVHGIKDLKRFKEECKKYHIVVKLNKVGRTQEEKKKSKKWQVEITDNGIGMTKQDLLFLSKTGSSDKNNEKKELIDSVPEYLWPSGTFGIGFQSVFLLTDCVEVETRKINKDYYVRAKMYNPSGNDEGAILIQTLYDENVHFGTTLRFEFEDINCGERLIRSDDKYTFSKFRSFDFAKNKHVNLLGMKVMDEVARFASGTFVDIDFYIEGDKKNYIFSKEKVNFCDIDEETGIQLYIEQKDVNYYDGSTIYYRNQCIRDYSPRIPFLKCHVNILTGSAKNVLTLNRDGVRQNYRSILYSDIKKTIFKHLLKKFDTYEPITKQLASMYLESNKDSVENNALTGYIERNDWQMYSITLSKKDTEEKVEKTIEELLKAEIIELSRDENSIDTLSFKINDIIYIINERELYALRSVCNFIMQRAQKNGYHLQLSSNKIVLSQKECELIDDEDKSRENLIEDYLRDDQRARGMFPCGKNYLDLRLRNNMFDRFSYRLLGSIKLDYPVMIFPYKRIFDFDKSDDAICLEYDVDNSVINTVYDNRIDKSVTKKRIETAYNKFKKEWGPIVDKVNTTVKKDMSSTSIRRYGHYSYIADEADF